MILTRDLLYKRHRLSHQQIDEFLSENLSREYLVEKMKLMEMVGEFIRITDSLNKAGINYILLKGPVLSYRLYNDASTRLYKDLDFLLDASSIEKAVEVLYNMGYVACYHEWPKNLKSKELFIWHRHHFNIWHPEKEVVIELHWKLFYFHYAKEEKIKPLIDTNLIELEFAGRQLNVFNPEFELLFLIIHGGQHDWKRLKWLVDIDKMLQVFTIDKEKFLSLSKRLRADRMVALCNAMLKEYFPDSELLPQQKPAPSFLIKFAHSQIIQEKGVEYDTVLGFLKFYWGKLISFPGFDYKISVIKQLFFMPEDMDNDQLPSSKFAFYLVGPLNKIKRRMKLKREEKTKIFN